MMNKSIEEIVEFLIDKKLTITTAESCTGGLIESAIVDIPGVSEIFHEGYVTYSNEAKERLLGVAPETHFRLRGGQQTDSGRDGSGCRKTAHTMIALSSTGVAGPDGGTKEHPVGDVYLGCCYNGSVMTQHMLGMRQPHRNTTAGSSSSIFTLRKNADRGEDTMRIIAGTARSLPLKTIEGKDTRPTTDRIKETLFNIIQMDVPRASFLDLFAGSGAIGLEALSRGANEAVFVENNKKAADCIEENIRFTKFTEESTLMRTDVLTALCQLEGRKYFDIVFMDPPYGKELEKEVLTYLATSKLIDEDSLIIVEMSDRTTFDYVHELGFTVEKLKKYKTNMLCF